MRGNTVAGSSAGSMRTILDHSNRQIEAARIKATRYIKRGGKVWIKIFLTKPITAKPAGTFVWVPVKVLPNTAAEVKPGRVMFEMDGVL